MPTITPTPTPIETQCECDEPIVPECNGNDLVIDQEYTFKDLDGSVYDSDGMLNGVLTVEGNLTLLNGGSITYNDPSSPIGADAGSISLDICGNIDMQAGSAIYAENRVGGGSGGDITVLADGNLTLRGTSGSTPGSIISSTKLGGGTADAGDISITVSGLATVESGSIVKADSTHSAGAIAILGGRNINISGLVSSTSTLSGTGTKQAPGGGTITIEAPCAITVSNEGIVRSKGGDPGADLVHLAACNVVIYGLIESTGPGHSIPNNPANHLSSVYRPDKSSNSTAGVEIWATRDLIIDALNHDGEINADIAMSGGTAGIAWIDLFAGGDIRIIGNTEGAFAVHANESVTNSGGGIITVKSVDGNVWAGGLALQAQALPGGSGGGSITVDADQSINLETASIFTRGDYVAMGGYGKGGDLEIRAFKGSLLWQNGTGDVRPTGSSIPVSSRGVISLSYCTYFGATGTVFSSNGTPTTPETPVQACGGAPQVPTYVSFMQCICEESPTPTPTLTPTITPTITPISTSTPTPTRPEITVTPLFIPTPTPTPCFCEKVQLELSRDVAGPGMIVDFYCCVPPLNEGLVDAYLLGVTPKGVIYSVLFDGKYRKGIIPFYEGYSSTVSYCGLLHRHIVCKTAEPGDYLVGLLLMPAGGNVNRDAPIDFDTKIVRMVK